MRFNNKHQYNSSFRNNRIGFTDNMKNNLINFANQIHNKNIIFHSKDFKQINYSNASKNDLIYFDPPYLLSCGVYQDGKRGFKGWNEQNEKDLYNLCDILNKQGIKFALSNYLKSKGSTNKILLKWSNNYNIHYFNMCYDTHNFQHIKTDDDLEILITNY